VAVSWAQALAWRMRRQLLEPVGTESVAGVVRRLGAIPALPEAAAELAVRARRERSRPGEVADALAEGRIIKTFAFRGATRLMTPEDGGAYLALRAASRMWELPSWQSCYGLTPSGWPILREAVREAGVPDLDEAGIRAVEGSFRAYGPATADHVHYWLGNGLGAGRKRIRSWLTAFGDRLGPGTADAHIVPPARRNLVSRQANIVIVGGVVSGTWSLTGDQVVIAWFPEARPPAREELAREAARLAAILDLPIQPAVQMT
jgi:DNA glycosylase AlkZ-like